MEVLFFAVFLMYVAVCVWAFIPRDLPEDESDGHRPARRGRTVLLRILFGSVLVRAIAAGVLWLAQRAQARKRRGASRYRRPDRPQLADRVAAQRRPRRGQPRRDVRNERDA